MTPDARRLPPTIAPRLLSREAAAEYLGMSAGHFDCHVARAVPPLRFGKRYLWDIKALDRFLDQQSGFSDAPEPVENLVERLRRGGQGAC
jgi:hypothetical protein